MSAATDTAQAIADPASASSDGQSVTARSASDLIALLNYQDVLANIGRRRRGIRYTRQTNPPALDDRCRETGACCGGFNGGC